MCRKILEPLHICLSYWFQIVISNIFLSFCLQDYWKSASPADRIRIQNMAFPSGVSFSKDSGFNRTSSENEALRIIRLFTSCFVDYKTTKKGTSEEMSFSVGLEVNISNLIDDLVRLLELDSDDERL